MALEILKPCAARKLMVSPVPELWWVRSSCVIFGSILQASPSRYPLYTVGGKRCLGLNVSAEQHHFFSPALCCPYRLVRAPFDFSSDHWRKDPCCELLFCDFCNEDLRTASPSSWSWCRGKRKTITGVTTSMTHWNAPEPLVVFGADAVGIWAWIHSWP